MRTFLLAAVLALIFAAPVPAQEEVRALHEVDRGPVLRGCTHLEPPAVWRVVPVRFLVTADGTVEPSSVKADRRGLHRLGSFQGIPSRLALEAEMAARSCVYDPASLNGVPVPVQMRAEFTFGLDAEERMALRDARRLRDIQRRRN